jgi:hypothetical protein
MRNMTVVTLGYLRIFDGAPGDQRWLFSAEFDGKREFAMSSPAAVKAGEWSNVRALLQDADGPEPLLLAWIEPGTKSWTGSWPIRLKHEALMGSLFAVAALFFAFSFWNSGLGGKWPLLMGFGVMLWIEAAMVLLATSKARIIKRLTEEVEPCS